MGEAIYLTGAKGGTGATTCAVKLAAALADSGERTLVVDGDRLCASGLEISGMRGLSVYTLADVEEGACRVKQAILNHPSSPNFYILPCLDCKSPETAASAVKECCAQFDYVICDSCARESCSRAVVVSDPYSVTAAAKTGAMLRDGGFKRTELLLNKVNGGLVYCGTILPPREFASVTNMPLLGVVPEDLTLPLDRMRGGTRRAFATAAECLCGRTDKLYGVTRGYGGVAGIFKRKMRERV